MIARKIERLDEHDRRLLVAASVQGHEFDSTTVSEALDIDAAEVEERLDALDRIHVFVKLVGEQEFADRTLTLRYRFVHILYQNTLYAIAAADAAGGAERQGGARRSCGTRDRARGRRGATGHPVRSGARFRRRREPVLRRGAPRGRPVRVPRSGARCRAAALKALETLPEDPARMQLELGLQLILGLSLRSIQGWAAPEVEKPLPARAADLPAAGQRAGAVPGALGADALPRHPRRSAGLRDAGRAAPGAGQRDRQSGQPGRRAPDDGLGQRVPRAHGPIERARRPGARRCTSRISTCRSSPASASIPG